MHRFLVPPGPGHGAGIVLDADDSSHAARVLRLGPGDRAEILDGAGGVTSAEVVVADPRRTELRTLSRRDVPRPARGLVLVVALLKGPAFDLVLEKSVELGAARILVLDAARCVARVGAAAAERKRAGWRLTLVAAMKQSGNPWLPVLEGPCAVADPAVRSLAGPDGRLYVAALRPGLPTLGLEAGRDPKAGTVAVAIGPEGDFTAEELGQFESFGARPVSLGPLVLRAETAAIAALAILGDHARR